MRTAQRYSMYSLGMRAALERTKPVFREQTLLENEVLSEEERMLQFDMSSWLPENTLMKSDKMTMQHSLEMRLPYLDHELVELGLSLPVKYKVHPHESKAVLRRALSGYLPKKIVSQQKNGFPVPLTAWLTDELKPEIKSVLLDPGAGIKGFFFPQRIEEMIHANSPRSSRLIWALYVLEVYLAFALHPQEGVYPELSLGERKILKIGGGYL